MSVATQLQAVNENFKTFPAAITEPILKAKSDHVASFDPKQAIQPGSKLPPFTLTDATGNTVSSASLLAKGPLLINFYRGEWCPFCSIALRGYQQRLPEFQSKGVTLVAISPELPNTSLSTVEKNELKFPVLSDVGNNYARELGILNQQPDAMRPVFKNIGHDLKARNGDDSFAVPVPTTLLVDKAGIVRNVHVDADYTRRLEPDIAVQWVNAL